jgi:hypothetical protein
VILLPYWSVSLLFGMILAAGQYPVLYPNGNPRPQTDQRLPIDEPQQVPDRKNQPSIDMVRVKRDADELAKLAGEIPASVEQANKGVVSKDLSDRLKRIEKLSKQLRRELYQ